MTPQQDETLRRLISLLLDGDLTQEQHSELVTLLKSDRSARKVYLQATALETQLQWQYGHRSATIETPRENNVIQGPWAKARKILAGTAAAAVAFGAWIATTKTNTPEPEQPTTIAEDTEPLKMETVVENGRTTAHVYFQFTDQDHLPES
jgi:hypothetical protein